MTTISLAPGVEFLAVEDGTAVLVDDLALLLSDIAGTIVCELGARGALQAAEVERTLADQFGPPDDPNAFDALLVTLVNSRIIVRN